MKKECLEKIPFEKLGCLKEVLEKKCPKRCFKFKTTYLLQKRMQKEKMLQMDTKQKEISRKGNREKSVKKQS